VKPNRGGFEAAEDELAVGAGLETSLRLRAHAEVFFLEDLAVDERKRAIEVRARFLGAMRGLVRHELQV